MATCTARLPISPGVEIGCVLEAGHYDPDAPLDAIGRPPAATWHCDTVVPGVGSRVWCDSAEGAIPHVQAPDHVDDTLILGEELLDDRATRSAVWRVVYAAVGGGQDPSLAQARAVARQLLADGWTFGPPLRDEDPTPAPALAGAPVRAWQVRDRCEAEVRLGEVSVPAGWHPATVVRVSAEDLEVELDDRDATGSRVTINFGAERGGTFPRLRELDEAHPFPEQGSSS